MSDREKKFTDVNELGEFGLIDYLTKELPQFQVSTIRGVGDDAAVIRSSRKTAFLASTDSLVEGIHFDLTYTPLAHLGYKAVVVNLSDIYAMNGTPTQIMVSLAFSSKYTVEAIEALYDGMKAACKRYGVDLVGGDMTSAPRGMMINVSAIGQIEQERITYRNSAKAGDLLCVSGDLGGAYLGLQLLEREKEVYLEDKNVDPELEPYNYLVGRQLKPEARMDIINMFAEADFTPTSMIDVSDGLASEVFHICSQSQVGALVEEANVPIHSQAEKLAFDFKLDPITCALSGGEDYELLFTADEKDLETVRYMTDVSIIGKMVPASKGIHLLSSGGRLHKMKAQGWKHFPSS